MKNVIAKLSSSKDLTEGKPSKLILNFGLPLLFGLIFQQFYNMVDTVIVGKKLGADALAAVGSTGSINFMVLGFCIGICNGFAIPVAQAYGAHDRRQLKAYITNSVWSSIVLAAIITVFIGIYTRQILVLLRTPDTIIDDAYAYIFIIFLGIPATFLYNLSSGILRSLGDSITPVIFLVASSLINIVLDLILVVPMGVAGAAVATVVSQAASGIVCTIYMTKKLSYLEFEKSDWHLSMKHCARLCGMGLPMGLQYSITAIGSVILQSAVNDMGDTYIAAVAAGTKITTLTCCPFDAMGSTMATYGGQNVGAGKLDRIGQGMRSCIIMGIIYALAALLFTIIFGKSLALLFVKKSEPNLDLLIHYIYVYAVANSAFYINLALVNIVRFMIQGLGYSTFAIIAGICEMVARAFAGFVLVPRYGYIFAALGSPLAWVFADLFLIPAYIWVMKQLRKKQGGQPHRRLRQHAAA